MMGIKSYLALGVLSYLFFLLVSIPASLPWSFLKVDPGLLVLDDISGTPWSGRVGKVVVVHFALGPLTWRLHGDTLLDLAPRVDFSLEGDKGFHMKGSGIAAVREMSLKVKDLTFSSPIPALTPIMVRIPVELTGQAEAFIKDLAIDRRGWIVAIDAGGSLKDVAIGPPWNKVLGGYSLEAMLGVDGEALVRIKDKEGAIRTLLVAKIFADGRYQLRGTLSAGNAMDNQLANLLKEWIGFDRERIFPVRASGHLNDLL
ncbi:MAG: type II secretion system protein N [Magnetococcales bacterium]|nr:type II secretion system protein N [Magnetococcales bacterium]